MEEGGESDGHSSAPYRQAIPSLEHNGESLMLKALYRDGTTITTDGRGHLRVLLFNASNGSMRSQLVVSHTFHVDVESLWDARESLACALNAHYIPSWACLLLLLLLPLPPTSFSPFVQWHY
jgi:hypothetical protein